MPRQGSRCFLMVRARAWMCALPLEDVEETMRPLPVAPVASAPAFVRGVSLVRGQSAPVVSLGALLGGGASESQAEGRFVSLRVSGGRVALEVDAVHGLRWLDEETLNDVPPLLRASAHGHLDYLGSLDGQLMAVLDASHLVPQDVWARLETPSGKASA
ncbi:chemotaxis protein CheW [Melittangium boletus]|uniref:Chemotaxis protein CheW n=1 Tax=Melittangium boletus DSM 14713 TaxID=1294270 RepID=A0A250I8L6_9BACT|nr:chemotaxis protein CheW [Melittangium boletus]ATB27548.1 chemotaxis protein CheW [Melittangium boletus DSM 14713]